MTGPGETVLPIRAPVESHRVTPSSERWELNNPLFTIHPRERCIALCHRCVSELSLFCCSLQSRDGIWINGATEIVGNQLHSEKVTID
jgi:hypothetical protein